jgi:hypothetical protein
MTSEFLNPTAAALERYQLTSTLPRGRVGQQQL